MKNYRLISVLMVILLCVSFVSCGEQHREYDEAEVIAEAKRLIPLAEELNGIFYGKGLEYGEENSNGAYKPMKTSEGEKYGFSTLDGLKQKTRRIFSEGMAETIFNSVMKPITTDDTILYYARYFQETDNKGNPTRVMVYSKYDYFLKGEIEYGDNVSVVGVKGQIVTVKVDVTLTSESGKIKQTDLEIEMIEEEDGWKFNSPSYAVYNESADIYEEMNKDLQ